jgi:hypothetical protein
LIGCNGRVKATQHLKFKTMPNNNNSGASSLEKATKLPTNASVYSTFGSPSALNAPLYNVAPKSSSEPMGGKETIANKCSKVVGMVTGLFTPPPTNVVAVSGYGGPIATPVTTTVSTSGYGGFIGSDSGVGQKCVHFNQGIGNGSEGGDPGKSAPRGGSNDEGGRTPGQRP